MKIAVIVAMQKELESIMSLLQEKDEENFHGFKFIHGRLDGKLIILHQCGIGKVNAAIGTCELINRYNPDILISSGCAGGLEENLKVMDVVASDSNIYHDVFIGGDGEEIDIQKPFVSDKHLVDKVKELMLFNTNVHIGQICTGDQFVTEKEKLMDIKRRYPDGVAVDMESCAIAQACQTFHVPFISFRIISDTIGSEAHFEEYKEFWSDMANQSFGVVRTYIESL